MMEILKQEPAVDAVVCSSALLATGAYKTLRQSGSRIPGTMGFVCFDDPSWAGFVDPPVTVIRQPAAAIGEAAAMSEAAATIKTQFARSGSMIGISGGSSEHCRL